jgi:cytochrome b6-f complex iron-sulfur subunit
MRSLPLAVPDPSPEIDSSKSPGPGSAPLGRRDLLKVACASTGALCGALAGCGGGGMPEPSWREVVTLPAAINGRVTLPLADFPQLAHVGGGLVGRSSGIAEPIAIARTEQTVFTAVVGVCTHLACILSYNALNATLDCPCHGSTFEVDGRVLTGPAERPLRVLPTELLGDALGVVAS